jgi:hypothetical protein
VRSATVNGTSYRGNVCAHVPRISFFSFTLLSIQYPLKSRYRPRFPWFHLRRPGLSHRRPWSPPRSSTTHNLLLLLLLRHHHLHLLIYRISSPATFYFNFVQDASSHPPLTPCASDHAHWRRPRRRLAGRAAARVGGALAKVSLSCPSGCCMG